MSTPEAPLDSGVRTPSQIRQQLKQVLFRHLQREMRDNFRDAPEACLYNRATAIGGTPERVGVCRYDGPPLKEVDCSPRGKICDTRVSGCVLMAKNCHFRQPSRTKEQVRMDFQALLNSKDRGRIASKYPDVAALMWVLDGIDISEEVQQVTEQVVSGGIE